MRVIVELIFVNIIGWFLHNVGILFFKIFTLDSRSIKKLKLDNKGSIIPNVVGFFGLIGIIVILMIILG